MLTKPTSEFSTAGGNARDHGATLRLGGGGWGTISDSNIGEGVGHKTIFLTNSIILKILRGMCPPQLCGP